MKMLDTQLGKILVLRLHILLNNKKQVFDLFISLFVYILLNTLFGKGQDVVANNERCKPKSSYQFFQVPLARYIMEKFLWIILLAIFIHNGASQRYASAGEQSQECGVQDRDELEDNHALAPWVGALFTLTGDLFLNNLKPEFLNTAIFISRNLAITKGSKRLVDFAHHSEINVNLQIYYGHRASGKQTLIRVRKVEPLNVVQKPLPYRLDTLPIVKNPQLPRTPTAQSKYSSTDFADLYILHLDSSIDIGPFSRPLCVSDEIFKNKSQYVGSSRSVTKVIHLSGYATPNETHGSHVVYFSGAKDWHVDAWDHDYISIQSIKREQPVIFGYQPKHFNSGSALTVRVNNQFYLAGILIDSPESNIKFRSIENLIQAIHAKGLNTQTHISQDSPSTFSEQGHSNQFTRTSGLHSGLISHETQYQSSTAIAQITYLKNIEATENAQLANSSRTASEVLTNIKPSFNSGPVASIKQPGTVIKPETLQQPSRHNPSESYNPHLIAHLGQNRRDQFSQTSGNNANVYQSHSQSPFSSIQLTEQYVSSLYKSTTPTSRVVVASSHGKNTNGKVHLLPQPEQIRTQPQAYYPQPQHKCSHESLEGVEIECLSRQRGLSSADCLKNAPPNTRIRLSCKPHYVSYDGEKVIEKSCDANGDWLPRKAFACKLDCGNVDRLVPYIVHGSRTPSEKWPWHAGIFRQVNDTVHSYICGATLITRTVLLTAAHCVRNSDGSPDRPNLFKVVVGAISSDLTANKKEPQAQEFDVDVIRVHENYNLRTFESDIALIQISKPVVLTEFVKPVCFPLPNDESRQVSNYQVSEGNNGIVVGFGITEDWNISRTLRMATLPVVSVKDCTDVLERVPSSTQYCAGYQNGTSVCEGDSGGSHIFKDRFSNRFYIQGIISHGNRREMTTGQSRCDNEKYTVFTKVGSFAEWVKKSVDDLEYDYNHRRRK